MSPARSRGRRGRKRRRSSARGAATGQRGAATGDPAARPATGPGSAGPAPSSGDRDATDRPDGSAERAGANASPYARAEEKNAAVRASLEPLEEGERPLAVTVGAVVALVLAVGNLVAYVAGVEVDGERPAPTFFAFPALLLVAAWGMWRVRYWAVLGMQAILALVLIGFSLNLMFAVTSDDFLVAGLSLLILAGAGALFWAMVRAMARIQMPQRR